ncbi:hypothetical protein JMJ77_0005666 [Colletotrichum scovillei]|uniref:Uncharacterized protein n=1 Tax=Colletotrichum scovillei TaxID=1209932 RepID=A0A9P7RIR1_9PEZI|nr:hypothetical protein JMJ77_0005666 [Colletotrichum scovillei]KAG7076844.1 hypothetical protein JMJ76_0014103 [Colletotrichum scovillei]KAG7083984.1 hypothetical protein JMJ78_0009424 [Colletotrichum scovillei]
MSSCSFGSASPCLLLPNNNIQLITDTKRPQKEKRLVIINDRKIPRLALLKFQTTGQNARSNTKPNGLCPVTYPTAGTRPDTLTIELLPIFPTSSPGNPFSSTPKGKCDE